MKVAIERLKAAQELETAQNKELGRQEGREWARKYASPRQLKRLVAARDQVNDWYIGQGSSAYSCGDLIAAVLDGTTDSPVRRAFENMVSPEFADLDNDPEFVQGFAEGSMEFWGEVQSIL